MAYVVRGVGGRGYVLVNNGYRYQRNWHSKTVLTWRCFREDCGSFIKTNIFDLEEPTALVRILKVKPNTLTTAQLTNSFIKLFQFPLCLRY
jgi:hypothetical protein